LLWMGRGIWTMDNRLVPTTLAPAFLAYFLPPPTVTEMQVIKAARR
jgi:hypothetical protein